jgi:hypothetical protein
VPYILAVVAVGDVAVVDTVTVVAHGVDVAAAHVVLAPRAAYVPYQDTHNVHPDIDEDSSYASFLR